MEKMIKIKDIIIIEILIEDMNREIVTNQINLHRTIIKRNKTTTTITTSTQIVIRKIVELN